MHNGHRNSSSNISARIQCVVLNESLTITGEPESKSMDNEAEYSLPQDDGQNDKYSAGFLLDLTILEYYRITLSRPTIAIVWNCNDADRNPPIIKNRISFRRTQQMKKLLDI
jgi:hypothetical protein